MHCPLHKLQPTLDKFFPQISFSILGILTVTLGQRSATENTPKESFSGSSRGCLTLPCHPFSDRPGEQVWWDRN